MSNTDGEYAKLQKGKFYWISIKQYNDGSQHAIRIADKWSVAQWDGHSFEEMNEMYRPEDVVKIGQIIPTQEELASLREQLKKAYDEINALECTRKMSVEVINESQEQLKQQEEVIRELTSSLTYIVETLGTLSTQQDELEALAYYEALRAIQKAKSLTTKDKCSED